MNAKNLVKLAKPWFEHGDRDLSDAKLLLREGGFPNTICFHCQQAVEKYLKGYLVYNGLDIKDEFKIHDLIKLLKYCRKFNTIFDEYQEEAEILNLYYIESRYPADTPQDYLDTEVKQTIEYAEEIIDAIKKLINY